MVVIELVDGCQLKCALCPNRFRTQSKRQMPLSIVEKVLKKYPKRWKDWFNWGEPTLHKDFLTIADMVCGTASRVSTNLSLPLSDDHIKALCKFRVVLVSMSGVTEATYRIYHRGGNFHLMKRNFERLMAERIKHKGLLHKSIVVNWLSHKYNEVEQDIAKKYVEGFGARFYPQLLVCTVEEQLAGFDHELLMNPRFQKTHRKKCRILEWETIGVDGSYFVCCSSQNVKIGYTIDDDVSSEDLIRAKSNIPMCKECQDRELWRMYS